MIFVVLPVAVRVGCTTRFIVKAALPIFFTTTLEKFEPRNSEKSSWVYTEIVLLSVQPIRRHLRESQRA